ncbi:MAG: hypothetical protein ACOC84_09955 [Actinomycetota bacterium]
MVPDSPADALGSHAPGVRDVLVEVVRSLHDRFAEAHQISGSEYVMVFGSQWRDLLNDVHKALTGRGFQSHTLTPAGYKLPVVNDCLVYVWRVPDTVKAVSRFASSPTKKNGFAASPPDPTLFDPGFTGKTEPAHDSPENAELERVVREVGDTMPLVLVMVHSSPRQLQSIEWAVAEFDEEADEVKLHGQESIWQPEPVVEAEASDVESFDSGTPTGPVVEPQEQEETDPDA